jgi:hypothetical protein
MHGPGGRWARAGASLLALAGSSSPPAPLPSKAGAVSCPPARQPSCSPAAQQPSSPKAQRPSRRAAALLACGWSCAPPGSWRAARRAQTPPGRRQRRSAAPARRAGRGRGGGGWVGGGGRPWKRGGGSSRRLAAAVGAPGPSRPPSAQSRWRSPPSPRSAPSAPPPPHPPHTHLVGREPEVQVLPLEQPVHERQHLQDELVLPQVVP